MEYEKRPPCPLIGANGNIFHLMGIASKTLKKNGLSDEAHEMNNRITHEAGSYDEALCILTEYVEPVSIDAQIEPEEEWEL